MNVKKRLTKSVVVNAKGKKVTFCKENILSRDMTKTMTKTMKWLCAQRRLGSAWASAQSDQSSLSAWTKLVSLAAHWAHSEDSDQTGRMPRLIWVFAGRSLILLVLSCRGSKYFLCKMLLSFLYVVIKNGCLYSHLSISCKYFRFQVNA